MRYIDLDGVILDTETLLFNEILNVKNKNKLTEDFIMQLVININWEYILKNAKVINDSINILKNMDPKESAILTKVHSKYEAEAKIKYFRDIGVKQDVIICTYTNRKNDIVNAKGNILVDDNLRNLCYWKASGGYPMFFDKNQNNIDSWDEYNVKDYQRVLKIDAPIIHK